LPKADHVRLEVILAKLLLVCAMPGLAESDTVIPFKKALITSIWDG
jgi:hypothetical protein